ncbi:MAG: SCO family protein, partial [Rhodoferax sp.]
MKLQTTCIRLLSIGLLKHLRLGQLGALLCAVATGLSVGAQEQAPTAKLDQRTALTFSQSVIGKKVDDFTLRDRHDQPVRLSQYRGKPLLVSFIYSGCFQVCPLTTRTLQAALQAGKDALGSQQFNVISIGFNQPADTPQSMKSFARQHRIDAPNWEFLSPGANIVEALTRQFGFSYVATPAGFDHILQVTLIDSEGRIYSQIYGDELTAEAIHEPIRQLLNNAPVAQGFQIDALIDRVRILCTVYD